MPTKTVDNQYSWSNWQTTGKESSSQTFSSLDQLKSFRIEKSGRSDEENLTINHNLPYVGKRIKQNLRNISFDDDSDEDADWRVTAAAGEEEELLGVPRKVLPRRQVAPQKSLKESYLNIKGRIR